MYPLLATDMVDSKAKGARAESQAKAILIQHTNLNWQRVPSSGALNASHYLKGDLYIPEKDNIFCVEVKHYKEDQINTKILTSVKSQLEKWWDQTLRQSKQINKKPLLIFKHDRSKFFIAINEKLFNEDFKHIYINYLNVSICTLEDWLKYYKPIFCT